MKTDAGQEYAVDVAGIDVVDDLGLAGPQRHRVAAVRERLGERRTPRAAANDTDRSDLQGRPPMNRV